MQDEYDFSKLDDEIEIVAGLYTPVAYGSLNLQDIISEFDSTSFISTNADGLLLITYQDSLFSFIADDLLNIPSQDFIEFFIESDFNIPPGWGAGDTVKLDRSQTFPFSFENGEQLDSMILDQGSMVFNISSEFKHTGRIIIKCPNIRRDNKAFTDTIPITVDDGTFTYNQPFVLDGYTIYLSDSVTTDSTFTYMPVDFHVELINSGAGFSVGEQIAITSTLENLDFDAIFGYIGDYELLTQTGNLDLGFFENTLDGYIRFEEPQINFNITNSYGVPAAVTISRFTGFNSTDSIQMIFDSTIDTFNYAYPTLTDYINSDIYSDTVISINSTNSNVSDFLAFLPSSLEYALSATSNPPGSDPSNFVSDESRIDIDFEFVLPLYFQADSFALEDTIELDLINIDDDASFIEKVNIILEVSNGLPLEIDFQVYFLDALYNPVDSLFAENARPVISSGIIDPVTNEVIAPGTKISQVTFTKDDISNLNTVRYGIIRAGLKTPSDSDGDLVSVKFFTDYSVDFNLSVGVDIKANSNDF